MSKLMSGVLFWLRNYFIDKNMFKDHFLLESPGRTSLITIGHKQIDPGGRRKMRSVKPEGFLFLLTRFHLGDLIHFQPGRGRFRPPPP